MKKKTLGNICNAGLKALACAILAVSLVASNFAGLYPKSKAYAAGTGKNLQIGSAVLMPEMSDSNESYDRVSKTRVTTAQTVYYGSNGTQRWLVIGYNGTGAVSAANTATLFAIDNMEIGKEYQAAGTSNSYVNSDIRKILIGESNENGEGGYYRDKFDNVEKTVILGRTLSQGEYRGPTPPDYIFSDGISDSSNPVDKLWLLSANEADLLKQDYRTASDAWWMRSPCLSDNAAAIVGGDGYVHDTGPIVDLPFGVRPAFNLNLQSIIFTSAAAGGKSSGNLGADALNAVGTSGNNTEWKLTIKDNSRNDFTASRTDSDTIVAGRTVEISYSGAKTGTGEYVSAIITDSSDTVLYYGNIAEGAASGTASINIPNDFAAGNKLYVFQEKCNGNNKTDYSSALINLTAPASGGGTSIGGNTASSSGTASEDYFADLKSAIEYARALGGNRTVTWNRDSVLNYDIMKLLAENPSITLAFSYTYDGFDYTVTIPGRLAKPDPEIPIYGPLYLYGMYGGTATPHHEP